MKKKIIVLAIAAAFSAPALADNGNIAWYGKVYLNAESVKNDKNNIAPAKDSAMRVLSNASRLGIKGSEDLGNGMNGIFQYEVQVDANGADGKGFGSSTRNSGVGLEGGFGKVIVGIWDTPFKVAHNKVELFDNTSSFTALSLIGHAGSSAISFNTRQSGVIEYWSPKMGALQGAISYSPDPAPQTSTGLGDRSRLSLAGTFEQDAISATAAYENRSDASVAGQTDSALRLVGKYTMGDIWVGATVESIKVNTLVATVVSNYTQKNVELVGQYKMGANKFAASYAKAGATNVASTGAHQLSLRYGHDYSARTEVFAAYTSLSNDTGSGYDLFQKFGVTANNSKQTVIGAGVIHTF